MPTFFNTISTLSRAMLTSLFLAKLDIYCLFICKYLPEVNGDINLLKALVIPCLSKRDTLFGARQAKK